MLDYIKNDETNLTNKIMFKNNIGKNCTIHRTAIIEDGAIIGDNVFIGPYSFIGKNVIIGSNCELKSHVVIEGYTEIGNNNRIFSFAVIGQEPQDLKYHGENSQVIIGDNNTIREHCTIHPGTECDSMVTKIGNNNLLMVNTHIAHDCVIENNCIIANNATLAGHIHIEDDVHLGGLCAIHQKVRVGKGSMLGGLSGLGEDLIPYGIAYAENGRRSSLQGLNLVGLKRAGFDKKDIQEVLHFYKEVFESQDNNSIFERSEEYRTKYPNNKLVNEIANFLRSDSERRFCTAR